MSVLLPASVHAAVVAMRGKCIDLDGVSDIPARVPLAPLRPVTIREVLAGWHYACLGYGMNTIRHPTPQSQFGLTLRDIATRQVRIAVVQLQQVAFIEGEPTSIDLTETDAATLRLAKYGWLRPATSGTRGRSR